MLRSRSSVSLMLPPGTNLLVPSYGSPTNISWADPQTLTSSILNKMGFHWNLPWSVVLHLDTLKELDMQVDSWTKCPTKYHPPLPPLCQNTAWPSHPRISNLGWNLTPHSYWYSTMPMDSQSIIILFETVNVHKLPSDILQLLDCPTPKNPQSIHHGGHQWSRPSLIQIRMPECLQNIPQSDHPCRDHRSYRLGTSTTNPDAWAPRLP